MTPVGLTSADDPDWLRLRTALWPDGSAEAHRQEIRGFLAEPARYAQFIARDADGSALGFVEASMRHDHVVGTSTSPVGFVEGLYVVPAARRRGVARRLVDEVAAWAAARGCRELASDTGLDNTISQAVHRRLGFAETERAVFFHRPLAPPDAS